MYRKSCAWAGDGGEAAARGEARSWAGDGCEAAARVGEARAWAGVGGECYVLQCKEEVDVRHRRTPTEFSGDSAVNVPVFIHV